MVYMVLSTPGRLYGARFHNAGSSGHLLTADVAVGESVGEGVGLSNLVDVGVGVSVGVDVWVAVGCIVGCIVGGGVLQATVGPIEMATNIKATNSIERIIERITYPLLYLPDCLSFKYHCYNYTMHAPSEHIYSTLRGIYPLCLTEPGGLWQ